MPSNKKPKDKNAPKRPLSGYMIFSNEQRPQIVAKNKDLKITEVSKKIGDAWAKLGDNGKKKYNEKAAKLKVAYDKELAKYKQSPKYKKYQKELSEWKLSQKETKKTPIKSKSKKKTPKKNTPKKKTPKKSKK